MKVLLAAIILVLLPLAVLKLCYAISTVFVLRKTKGALFVSTSRAKIKAILEALPLSPETRLADLGCGDGRFLRAAFKRYGVKGVGFEINPWAYFLARLWNFLGRVPVEVRRKNFLQEDLSRYDVVFCYLFPDLLLELAPKLREELRPGAVVVSANFPLPGWEPYLVLHVGDPIYFYRKT
ncbi:MAG: class I SAM-dependent methyltransferase [Thermodesulfobacteria bacterium]|nr:class I SAM-dependent methyltransferase [Thermodesulfobacteriota bacterium]